MGIKKLVLRIFIVLSIGLLVYSCANKAQGPTGGPKDETPPKVLKSTPLNGALNFKKKVVQIIFDENVSVEKPTETVVISPPQAMQPDVKGNARIVTVTFGEELLDSTTYTINFGSSIEGNDSLFFKKPFLRIGKTDENGHFTIDNCKPGKYRLYALGDVSKDYYYQLG